MLKNKTKKELTQTERHFGVVLENIDSKLEKVGRDEFIFLEKRVLALEKAKK